MANALVQVDDQEFGTLPVETDEGKWYVVKPTSPVKGSSIKVSTTTKTFLCMADIQVFGQIEQKLGTQSTDGAAKRLLGMDEKELEVELSQIVDKMMTLKEKDV